MAVSAQDDDAPAMAQHPLPATNRGKIGALYAAFMDRERIEAVGAAPLKVELAPVLAADSKEELASALGAGLAAGFCGAVGVDVENDLNDPQRYTTWMPATPAPSPWACPRRGSEPSSPSSARSAARGVEPHLRRQNPRHEGEQPQVLPPAGRQIGRASCRERV